MKLTPEKLTAFCAALAETCQVSKACAAVDISRVTAYKWRDDMPEFAEAWDKALKVGTSVLEDEAIRRAREGWDEPVFHQGAECGAIRKYSDTLLIFTLKAHAPEKYREHSKVEFSGHIELDESVRAARIAQLMAVAQSRAEQQDDELCDLA